jgi:hypothetical protein
LRTGNHRDVVQHPWEESGFCRAQQKAHDIEALRALDEGHAHRDRPPGDEDACEPAPGAKALQQQIARDFEKEITNEEQPGAKAVGHVADTKISIHVQLGEAHRRAVDIGHEVQQHQEGNQPERERANDPSFRIHSLLHNYFCNGWKRFHRALVKTT